MNLFDIITNYKIHLVTGDEIDLTDEDWVEHLCHILIGGNKLDRGFTVKNLICTYMPRYSKDKSNADTIQQRCRFFGYKKDYKLVSQRPKKRRIRIVGCSTNMLIM